MTHNSAFIERIELELGFDDDGNLQYIEYLHTENCGTHVGLFLDNDQTVEGLVRKHLEHCREEHEVEPRKRCPMVINAGAQLRCKVYLDEHELKPHNFEMERK